MHDAVTEESESRGALATWLRLLAVAAVSLVVGAATAWLRKGGIAAIAAALPLTLRLL